MRRRGPDAGRREAGSVHVIVAVVVTIGTLLMFVLLHKGKMQTVRMELQNAADTLGLIAAAAVREHGPAGGGVDLTDALPLYYSMALPSDVQTEITVHDDQVPGYYLVVTRLYRYYVSPFNLVDRTPVYMEAVSYARVHFQRYLDQWPVVMVAMDVSGSMGAEDSDGISPFDRLRAVLERFTTEPFPVRIGAIAFNNEIRASVAPPSTQVSNATAVREAMDGVTPGNQTNIRKALEEAKDVLAPFDNLRRDVVIITDGDATAGWQWNIDLSFWDGGGIHLWDSSEEMARRRAEELRKMEGGGATLFTLETQAVYGGGKTKFLKKIAGAAGSDGNDESYYYRVQDTSEVDTFLAAMSRRACSADVPDIPEFRDTGWVPVFAGLVDSDGNETPLPRVTDAVAQHSEEGFEFMRTNGGGMVLLTMTSCHTLGQDPTRRLVVRWGEPELIPAP